MARSGATRSVLIGAIAFALLTLPFDPRWIDFEHARRGLLLVVAGLLCAAVALRREWPGDSQRGAGFLSGFLALTWVGISGATNENAALLDALYWSSLGILFVLAVPRRLGPLSRALLPAIAVAAIYGLAQALGLEWPSGYATRHEPVSTLGNTNVAAELGAVGFAVAALAVCRATTWTRMLVASIPLVLSAAWLGVLASRGGWLAAAVGLGFAAVGLARRYRALRLVLLTLAVVAGVVAATERRAGHEPTDEQPVAEAPASPSTIAVRFELWKGGLDMVADEPLFGHGTGQFRYEYPRYRAQEEIELTSFERRFATTAATVHQDWLEIAIELGIVGLLLLLAFAARVVVPALRTRRTAAALAPLMAFAAVTLVRSPMANAPVAAVVFVWAGVVAQRARHPRRGDAPRWVRGYARLAWGVIAVFLLWTGGRVVFAETAAAVWLRGGDDVWLDRAIDAFEDPRYLRLRVETRCGGTTGHGTLARTGPEAFDACRDDLARARELDPHNVQTLLRTAELALSAGDVVEAERVLAHARELDPGDSRAVLLTATAHAAAGRPGRAVDTLYAHDEPRLRERLATILQEFADAPALATHDAARRLFEREATFVRAVDQLLARPGTPLANAAVQQFVQRAGAGDDRARVLVARQFQALDDDAEADRLAEPPIELDPATRRLLAPVLDELSSLPSW